MQRELHVYIDLDNEPVLIGRLWARERSGRESSSFVYDETWRARRGAFALSPALPLGPGQFNTNRALFTAFTDAAPDSWGETLMRRHERAEAKKEDRAPRTMFAVDFLAGVDDRTRMGAVRFKDPSGSVFLTTKGDPVHPLIDLSHLLAAATRFDKGRETNKDLALLLAPGTSLGGARPKATVRDKDGRLLVAKFPKRDDDWPVTQWEATTLDLAKAAGITVSTWHVETIANKAVLLLRRFDRTEAKTRTPFMSAMTALDETDHSKQQRSYLELAEVLRREGSKTEADLKQLWRRIVFNILVSNTDDHLRNHGFLRRANGWELSPAFDMNPCPAEVKPRVHKLAIDEFDGTASLETALSVAVQFSLTKQEADTIAATVGAAVSDWRNVAKKYKLKAADIEHMSSAFEHDDLRRAIRNVAVNRASTKKSKTTKTKAKSKTAVTADPR
jgi:serine/threonine-protein kinase HipA